MADAHIRLVTRGDDSGSCNTANVAIWNAYRLGILRNTSIIVPAPAFEEAAQMYAGEPGFCVGLHATLTAEWDTYRWGPVLPLDEVPSLVQPDGSFFPTTQQLHANDPQPDEMMAEIAAQLELARARGLDIRYVDTHMGFGWVKDIDARIAEFADTEGLIYRPQVDRLPKAEGEHRSSVEALIARLEAAEPGTYLIVGHPTYDRDEVNRMGPGQGKARDWQRRMFMDREVVDYCNENDILPIRYSDI